MRPVQWHINKYVYCRLIDLENNLTYVSYGVFEDYYEI